MKKNKIISFLILVTIILSSCERNKGVEIKGKIDGAEGKIIILESNDARIKTDTLKIDENGEFITNIIPLQYPEFMTLNIDNNIISLAVDSAERIHITGIIKDLVNTYKV